MEEAKKREVEGSEKPPKFVPILLDIDVCFYVVKNFITFLSNKV